jgi:hypothetical protein
MMSEHMVVDRREVRNVSQLHKDASYPIERKMRVVGQKRTEADKAEFTRVAT